MVGNTEAAKILLDHGADISDEDVSHGLPLQCVGLQALPVYIVHTVLHLDRRTG